MIKLNQIGINIRHIGEFCIDRPEGSGDYLLVIFKTNALLYLRGQEMTVPPDSAVIFRKGSPQLYKTVCGCYVNHFLHFETDKDDRSNDIIYDTLLIPTDIMQAEKLLEMLSIERLSDSPNRDKYISILIELLLMKLSEKNDTIDKKRSKGYSSQLNSLRAEMYSNPASFGKISQLAEKMNLSSPHFQQLYKAEFGTSCYEDLLTAKMKAAQYYLSGTDFPIKEIAQLCGYSNVTCFLHRFRKRMGMTPSEYRDHIDMT